MMYAFYLDFSIFLENKENYQTTIEQNNTGWREIQVMKKDVLAIKTAMYQLVDWDVAADADFRKKAILSTIMVKLRDSHNQLHLFSLNDQGLYASLENQVYDLFKIRENSFYYQSLIGGTSIQQGGEQISVYLQHLMWENEKWWQAAEKSLSDNRVIETQWPLEPLMTRYFSGAKRDEGLIDLFDRLKKSRGLIYQMVESMEREDSFTQKENIFRDNESVKQQTHQALVDLRDYWMSRQSELQQRWTLQSSLAFDLINQIDLWLDELLAQRNQLLADQIMTSQSADKTINELELGITVLNILIIVLMSILIIRFSTKFLFRLDNLNEGTRQICNAAQDLYQKQIDDIHDMADAVSRNEPYIGERTDSLKKDIRMTNNLVENVELLNELVLDVNQAAGRKMFFLDQDNHRGPERRGERVNNNQLEAYFENLIGAKQPQKIQAMHDDR